MNVQEASTFETLVRGLRLTPILRKGLAVTVVAALVATAGRVIVPVVIQFTLDHGIVGTPNTPLVLRSVLIGGALLALTTVAAGVMAARLARTTETALADLRVRAFRHIHDLSMLHQAAEQRGALVSRVTSDIDTISQFLSWGGIALVVQLGQLVLATVVMFVYSWQLALVVLATFVPLLVLLAWFQQRLARAYSDVRRKVGRTMSVVAEAVVGAPVIRAYGIEERTDRRVHEAVDEQFRAAFHSARLAGLMFSSGEVFAAIAMTAVVVVGVLIGLGGNLSTGTVVAFLFLATLFISPVHVVTESLDLAQSANAGWRRILELLDTPADVADPAHEPHGGVDIPPGPIGVQFRNVRFTYPPSNGQSQGPVVLHDLDIDIAPQSRIAVVGETGSGKTTFVKVLTRLMDPTAGLVLVNGVQLDQVRFSSLRQRIVMVPQDGFLFDDTIEENVRHGRPGSSSDDLRLAFVELGLVDWLESLPQALETRVGERGEFLSVGERQLVSLTRAYVANPDLLVLDEATSAVDPATEARIHRALEGLTRGRTAISIAHRLSTAESADEVLVFDAGRIVQRGPHDVLVSRPGVYARLHANWLTNRAR